MLLTMEEVETQLEQKFSLFAGEMDDLILKKRVLPLSNVEIIEGALKVKFPADFVSFMSKYDIDDFSLGQISFGHGGDYLNKLLELNGDGIFNHWWIGEYRPDGIILIALSDPYSILLNTKNGKVYAITSDSSMDNWLSAADSFELFIRGVGSVFLKKSSLSEVENLVGSHNQAFWESMRF